MGALETIRAVPIARVGTWETSTGRWVCTREQLADAVRASKDPAFRRAVVKLGHTDPRFDGTPAVGGLENLRVDASGDVLLADLVGVPAPLAAVLNSAYPSRSVEASLGVATAGGNAYAMVITGLALLGDTPPAIESLADVLNLFDQPQDVEDWVAAATVAASIGRDGTGTGRPPVVVASSTIDEVVTAAVAYATANGITYPWVREVYTDKVIVASDDPPAGRLWELGWTAGKDGPTFTGPVPVKIEYTRVAAPVAAGSPAQSMLPLLWVRGRGDVSASIPEEHPPVSDLATLVRERLGLTPEATDDDVTAAIVALQEKAAPAPAPVPDPDPAPVPAAEALTGEPLAASAAERRQEIAAAVEAATAPLREVLASATTELADRRERERLTHRETLLASARDAGKITPADVGKYRAMFDKGPEHAAAVEDLFATIAASSAIPVGTTPGAHTGGQEPGEQARADADYYALFPDEKPSAGVNV